MPDMSLLKDIQGFILDMDGVLWRGDSPFDGLQAVFQYFNAHNVPYILATNNSTKTVETYVERLNNFGFETTAEHIVTSAVATAEYLRANYAPGTRVHVVGETGLNEILEQAGFRPVATEADLVVVGLDRDLTYKKLCAVAQMIHQGATFIGTNGDKTFPIPGGLIPGTGSILAAVEAGTGQAPLIMGKPERVMYDISCERLGLPAANTLMVGDRLETDILGAQRAGLPTALGWSGVTTPEILEASAIKPDMAFDNLRELFEAWREVNSV